VHPFRAFKWPKYHGTHGLEALAPDLELPEYIAYPRYWKDLPAVEPKAEGESSRMERVVEDARGKADDVAGRLANDLDERGDARAERSAVAQAAGSVKDQAPATS